MRRGETKSLIELNRGLISRSGGYRPATGKGEPPFGISEQRRGDALPLECGIDHEARDCQGVRAACEG
ncbi:MAG: hypothetical protein JWQ44_321 [Chthoniobacter sp.]|nr:hypothetical protein [Chthoniobacter sp.]